MKQPSQCRNPRIRPTQTALVSAGFTLMVFTLSSCKSKEAPPKETFQAANANASAQTATIAAGANASQLIHIANSNNVSIDAAAATHTSHTHPL